MPLPATQMRCPCLRLYILKLYFAHRLESCLHCKKMRHVSTVDDANAPTVKDRGPLRSVPHLTSDCQLGVSDVCNDLIPNGDPTVIRSTF
jgi:hypothetical protein